MKIRSIEPACQAPILVDPASARMNVCSLTAARRRRMSSGAPATDLDPGEAARQTLAQRRSEQLLSAAAQLMERDGSQSVSMHAVAEEAGVSVGLIYRYFGGKHDLLLAVIVNVLDAFGRQVPAAIQAAGTWRPKASRTFTITARSRSCLPPKYR